jgi:hypothetical protein
MMAAIVRNLGVDRYLFPVINEGDRKSIDTYLNLGVNCDRKARQRLRPIYPIQRCWSAYSGRKFTPNCNLAAWQVMQKCRSCPGGRA